MVCTPCDHHKLLIFVMMMMIIFLFFEAKLLCATGATYCMANGVFVVIHVLGAFCDAHEVHTCTYSWKRFIPVVIKLGHVVTLKW